MKLGVSRIASDFGFCFSNIKKMMILLEQWDTLTHFVHWRATAANNKHKLKTENNSQPKILQIHLNLICLSHKIDWIQKYVVFYIYSLWKPTHQCSLVSTAQTESKQHSHPALSHPDLCHKGRCSQCPALHPPPICESHHCDQYNGFGSPSGTTKLSIKRRKPKNYILLTTAQPTHHSLKALLCFLLHMSLFLRWRNPLLRFSPENAGKVVISLIFPQFTLSQALLYLHHGTNFISQLCKQGFVDFRKGIHLNCVCLYVCNRIQLRAIQVHSHGVVLGDLCTTTGNVKLALWLLLWWITAGQKENICTMAQMPFALLSLIMQHNVKVPPGHIPSHCHLRPS